MINIYQKIREKLVEQTQNSLGYFEVTDRKLFSRQISNLNNMNMEAQKSMLKNTSYENYCGYCDSKLFPNDRTCPQCGAPTKNYISKEINIDSPEIKYETMRENPCRDFGELSLYSDIRIMDKGDSQCFNIFPRDIFCVLKNGRKNNQIESHKEFKGQVAILTNLNSFVGSDISELFSCAIRVISPEPTDHLQYSGFNISDFVTLSQKVSAYNAGRKSLIVGTRMGIMNILPQDINYKYSIGEPDEIKFVGNIYGTDAIMLPSVSNYKNPFASNLPDNRIWIVSPTEGKLLKIVSDDDSFVKLGIGLGISSTYGMIEL